MELSYPRLTNINPEQQVALDAIFKQGQSHRPVTFITGGAGTGKTALVREIKAIMYERVENAMIVAPTGVAAINAGGSTIHSQFKINASGLPRVNPNIETRHPELCETIRSTKMLVIDEISMVRADLLDVVINTLKRYGPDPLAPYGGIQLVLVGDLLQLPPILGEDTKERLQYKNAGYDPKDTYFLTSRELHRKDITIILLRHNYRLNPADPYAEAYLKNLNIIRKGCLTKPRSDPLTSITPDENFQLHNQTTLTELEQACIFFNRTYERDARRYHSVTITAMRKQKDNINKKRMRELEGKPIKLEAKVRDYTERKILETMTYCEKVFMSPWMLEIKKGARVMITKNFTLNGLALVNGTMAEIIDIRKLPDLDEGAISASMAIEPWKPLPPKGENYLIDLKLLTLHKGKEITIGRETWRQTDFVLDKKSHRFEEVTSLEFTQYPVMLAWAVTIHKSQGLTLEDYAVMHQGNPAPHLVYVALSRASRFSDIHLDRKIKASDINTNPKIVEFYESLNG